MKRTSDGQWAHSFCAIWHPAIALRDATTTPIIRVRALGKKATKVACGVCDFAKGPMKQCQYPGCVLQYHPLCAWFEGHFIDVYDSARQRYELEMNVFCPGHTPAELSRNAASQKRWRNKDRVDIKSKKRRGVKISVEEKTRQQRVRASAAVPDQYADKTCAVCFSAQPEYGNALIQCISCKLYCHQDCYGVPAVPPNGSWRCSVCEAG